MDVLPGRWGLVLFRRIRVIENRWLGGNSVGIVVFVTLPPEPLLC